MKHRTVTAVVLLGSALCLLSADDPKKDQTRQPKPEQSEEKTVDPIQVSVQCDQSEYRHGQLAAGTETPVVGKLRATLTVKNVSKEGVERDCGDQQFDFIIRSSEGKTVKRWSDGKTFDAVMEKIFFRAGRIRTWSAELLLGEAGKPLPSGTYTLEGRFTCSPPSSATATFSIITAPAVKP
jgi:hypothetical protein